MAIMRTIVITLWLVGCRAFISPSWVPRSSSLTSIRPHNLQNPCRITSPLYSQRRDRRAEQDNRSLAEKMFGDVFGAMKGAAKSVGIDVGEEPAAEVTKLKSDGKLDAADAISDIDSRAQTGELTYQDFLALSQTFNELGGKVPGEAGKLSEKEIFETKAKFIKHEKIVRAMLPEELKNPDLMVEDLNNTEQKLPRVQRLARESGVSERDVALFIAEFEAMRQSTARIASGEDPDEVMASLGNPSNGNRSARRAVKKMQRKAASKKGNSE